MAYLHIVHQHQISRGAPSHSLLITSGSAGPGAISLHMLLHNDCLCVEGSISAGCVCVGFSGVHDNGGTLSAAPSTPFTG